VIDSFVGPPIFDFSSSSSRGRANLGWSCFCCFWSPRGWRRLGRRWCRSFSKRKRLHFVAFSCEF
jgi:hypothetical protein